MNGTNAVTRCGRRLRIKWVIIAPIKTVLIKTNHYRRIHTADNVTVSSKRFPHRPSLAVGSLFVANLLAIVCIYLEALFLIAVVVVFSHCSFEAGLRNEFIIAAAINRRKLSGARNRIMRVNDRRR